MMYVLRVDLTIHTDKEMPLNKIEEEIFWRLADMSCEDVEIYDVQYSEYEDGEE